MSTLTQHHPILSPTAERCHLDEHPTESWDWPQVEWPQSLAESEPIGGLEKFMKMAMSWQEHG